MLVKLALVPEMAVVEAKVAVNLELEEEKERAEEVDMALVPLPKRIEPELIPPPTKPRPVPPYCVPIVVPCQVPVVIVPRETKLDKVVIVEVEVQEGMPPEIPKKFPPVPIPNLAR